MIRTGRLGTPRFVRMLNAPTDVAAPWMVAGALPSNRTAERDNFVANGVYICYVEAPGSGGYKQTFKIAVKKN